MLYVRRIITWNLTLSSIEVSCSTNSVSCKVKQLRPASGLPPAPASASAPGPPPASPLSAQTSCSFQTCAFSCSPGEPLIWWPLCSSELH